MSAAMNQPPLITREGVFAMMQNQGMDPQRLDAGMDVVYRFVCSGLPNPPVYTSSYLSAADGAGAVEDRVSALPDNILRRVVSRLPAKDAARTAVLSWRWSRLWRSAPLVVVDTHLLLPGTRGRPTRASSGAITTAVSRVLEAHQGPFRCVNLTCCYMDAHPAELARWLHLLAVNGTQELVFVNRPWPMNYPLPASVFTIPHLSRLYLGIWRFPDTAALPRGSCFPNLKELGLCFVMMEDRDLEFVLSHSPILENLTISASQRAVRLRLVSRSMRFVQLYMCTVEDIAVVEAPLLERLLLWETFMLEHNNASTIHPYRLKFSHVPNLQLLGYLRPGIHILEIGNTIIKAGTKPSPRTIIPSVKILALKVHFEVRNEAKMLPCFLSCFPNVEMVHVESEKADEPTGRLNLKFWQEAGHIECVHSRIKKMVFDGCRGERNELAFIKFILESAEVLQDMLIQCVDNGSFSSTNQVAVKVVKFISSINRSSEASSVAVTTLARAASNSASCLAPDFSASNPFCCH